MTDMQNRALHIARKCAAAGMTTAGAAGVLINIQYESAFLETNVEDRYHSDTGKSDADYTQTVDTNPGYDFANDNGRHYGYGLCQWTLPSRKAELRQLCRSRGVSIGDRDTQIEFMITELKRDFPGVWKTLTGSDSWYNCAWQMCRWFENPANAEAQAASRGAGAEQWYRFLTEHPGDAADAHAGQSDQTTTVPTDGNAGDPAEEKPEEDGSGSTAAQATTSWPPRTIDRNCFGWPEVWLLQSHLKCRGYNVLVDGIWSQSLEVAVKVFQVRNGLEPDGVVGPKTWAALLDPEVR